MGSVRWIEGRVRCVGSAGMGCVFDDGRLADVGR